MPSLRCIVLAAAIAICAINAATAQLSRMAAQAPPNDLVRSVGLFDWLFGGSPQPPPSQSRPQRDDEGVPSDEPGRPTRGPYSPATFYADRLVGGHVRFFSRRALRLDRLVQRVYRQPIKLDLAAVGSPRMSTKADIKALRGTKRSCQNEQCGARFYDLNQDPITCPVCHTVYVIPISPPPQPLRAAPRPARKPVFVPDEIKPEAAPEAEGEDLVELEGAADDNEQEDAGEPILETEEDTSDVSAIMDAPIDDDKEK